MAIKMSGVATGTTNAGGYRINSKISKNHWRISHLISMLASFQIIGFSYGITPSEPGDGCPQAPAVPAGDKIDQLKLSRQPI
jgi:hypothetical protein